MASLLSTLLGRAAFLFGLRLWALVLPDA